MNFFRMLGRGFAYCVNYVKSLFVGVGHMVGIGSASTAAVAIETSAAEAAMLPVVVEPSMAIVSAATPFWMYLLVGAGTITGVYLVIATVKAAIGWYNEAKLTTIWEGVKSAAYFPVVVVKEAGSLLASTGRGARSASVWTWGAVSWPFRKTWNGLTYCWAKIAPDPKTAEPFNEEKELGKDSLLGQLENVVKKMAGPGPNPKAIPDQT